MKKIKVVLEYLIIFLCSFCALWFTAIINVDEIWNYGFSYNISQGLIPYQDFNMIITPFYPFLMSLFLKINSSLITFYIVNSVIFTLIYYLTKQIKGDSAIVLYIILSIFSMLGYNVFLLFLMLLLIFLEKKKTPVFLIGMVASFAVLTKQSMFPFLTIALLWKKDVKEILKRLSGYIFPFIIFLIWLLASNTMKSFLDYCFFGLSSFQDKNLWIQNYFVFFLYLLFLFYFVFKLIKDKNNTEIIYILAFQILAYPIFDISHMGLVIWLDLFYFIDKIHLSTFIKKVWIIGFIFLVGFKIYNNVWDEDVHFASKFQLLKGRLINVSLEEELVDCVDYIKEKNIKNTYIFDSVAYLIKLEWKVPINKFDLINDGNMGVLGAEGYMEEIDNTCKNESCLFVLRKSIDKEVGNQLSIELIDYVKNNYEPTDETLGIFEFYKN